MSDSRPVGDMRAVQREMNLGRTSIYKLMREDPSFPAPFTMGPVDKLTFFLDEIRTYMATQPRRQYAGTAI